MYQKQRQQRKRTIDYILPFLIFICFGLIVVLGIQLYQNVNGPTPNNEAQLYIAEGKTKLLPWGVDKWEPGYNNSKIRQGDSVQTSSSGKAVLELFDRSIVRLGANTKITIEEFNQDKNNYYATINLEKGKAWVKTANRQHGNSHIEIKTPNLKVKNNGTIFSISNDQDQTVHLLKGKVDVEVFIDQNNKPQLVERIHLKPQKQVTITPSVIAQYTKYETPKVEDKINPNFLNSSWHQWNSNQDKNPTPFSTTNEPTLDENSATSNNQTDPDETAETATETNEDTTTTQDLNEELNKEFEEEIKITPPTITSPAKNHQTEKNIVKIKGKAPKNATKIVVITQDGGTPDHYALKNFKSGNTTWSYTAATKFKNLQEGSNTYKVYAQFPNGKKSEVTTITINFTPPKEEEKEPAAETKEEPKKTTPTETTPTNSATTNTTETEESSTNTETTNTTPQETDQETTTQSTPSENEPNKPSETIVNTEVISSPNGN